MHCAAVRCAKVRCVLISRRRPLQLRLLLPCASVAFASALQIPGCPRGALVGSSCQAHGLELLGTNAVTVLSEPIVDAEQKQRAWAGAVEVRGSGRAKTVGDVHVDNESSVKTYSHAFFLPFTKDGKNFVFVKPET